MPINRRDLLTASLATIPTLSSLAMLTGCSKDKETPDSSKGDKQPDLKAQSTFDFWTKEVRDPNAVSKAPSPGNAPRAQFVYYDEKKGFLAGSDIGDDGLADKGDLNVVVNVDHIRPSTSDQQRFQNLEGGSLRIDLQQANPLPTLTERLAWTAMAGFLPKDKKLPDLKEMTFDPGSTWGKLQTVPLPGGGGRWTWNFFLKHKESRWMQIFDVIRRNKNLLIPIFGLGLPAIAITALNTVDAIVGEITKNDLTEWLFQSSDVFIYGTKEAKDSFEGTKLRLKQGMYVVVPSDQLSAFGKASKDLVIKDGLVVPKNTSSLDSIEAAKQTIPDITYLTVGVSIKGSEKSKGI